MPFTLTFDKKDDAPEAIRSLLTEKDGKFIFEGETATEIANLKSALDTERTGGRATKTELEKLRKQIEGLDLEKARQLLADADKAAAETAKAKGDWEAREKQLLDKHAAEISKLQDREKALQRAIERHLVEAQATAAIAAAKGVPELLLPHVIRAISVVEENGEFSTKVVDTNGNPRIGDAKGTPMTISQLVEEFRSNEIFGRAFEASGAGGSGAINGSKGAGGGQKNMTREAFDALDQAGRMKAAKEGVQIVD